MPGVTEAMEKYFAELDKYFNKFWGTAPSVPYSESLNKSLIVSSEDEEGYVEWKPARQTKPVDWAAAEAASGFEICSELKEYYSSWLFLRMNGPAGKAVLEFDPVMHEDSVSEMIMTHLQYGLTAFPHSETFLLGSAQIRGNGSYAVFYDNSSSEVFCCGTETFKKVKISDSLADAVRAITPAV